jgi:hypothetical protein
VYIRVIRGKSRDDSEEHIASIFRVEVEAKQGNKINQAARTFSKRRLTFTRLHGITDILYYGRLQIDDKFNFPVG